MEIHSLVDPFSWHEDTYDDTSTEDYTTTGTVDVGTLALAIGSQLEDDGGGYTQLSGDGTIDGGLAIAIPQAANSDFYYGYGGTESHFFGGGGELEIGGSGLIESPLIVDETADIAFQIRQAGDALNVFKVKTTGSLPAALADAPQVLANAYLVLQGPGKILADTALADGTVILGSTTGEDISFDFDHTANEVHISSGTGVTKLDFAGLNLLTTGPLGAGDITTTGLLKLPTTSATVGQIQINNAAVFHTYSHATATGQNLFMGGAGNFTLHKDTQDYEGGTNIGIGQGALHSATHAYSNLGIGFQSLYYMTTGYRNIGIGAASGQSNNSGAYNVDIGYYSGTLNSTGSRNINIGAFAGYRNLLSDRLIIDNQQRASVAEEITNAIVYGVMAAAPANQTLRLNAATLVSGTLDVTGNIDPTTYETTNGGFLDAISAPYAQDKVVSEYGIQQYTQSQISSWTQSIDVDILTFTELGGQASLANYTGGPLFIRYIDINWDFYAGGWFGVQVPIPTDWDAASDIIINVLWIVVDDQGALTTLDVKAVVMSVGSGDDIDSLLTQTLTKDHAWAGAKTAGNVELITLTIDYDDGDAPLAAGDMLKIRYGRGEHAAFPDATKFNHYCGAVCMWLDYTRKAAA